MGGIGSGMGDAFVILLVLAAAFGGAVLGLAVGLLAAWFGGSATVALGIVAGCSLIGGVAMAVWLRITEV